MKKTLLVGLAMLVSGSAYAAESQSMTMEFEQCLEVIRRTSTDLGVAPINIAETNIMRIVRYVTEDGSVLITCSKPDRKMVVTKSN